MSIRLLDDQLINKIAAGEVIERPASVVKELVENSIDASSSRIAVKISGGGIDRIEVIDDGAGIAFDNVALALQRHATSKITAAADLWQIDTMGFRGEALPSIGSVSRLELYTQFGDQTGTRASLEGGKGLKVEPFAAAPGTRIVISDLFFNTPARRKFLKSPVTEGNHVHGVVSRLALSRPDISFSFANEKKLYYKTPGNNDLRDTMIAIFGQDYTDNFLDLEWGGADHRLQGLVSRPEFRRRNRQSQIFFVNNRLIKSPLLARAVDEGYRGLLLAREHAAVILFLTIDKNQVDVNVHPQKTEVRFRDEKTVFRIISHGIRDKLGNTMYSGNSVLTPVASPGSLVRPVPHQPAVDFHNQAARFYDPVIPFSSDDHRRPIAEPRGLANIKWIPGENDYAVIGQCFDSYILVERDQALWLVDQHAAQERILFSRLLEQDQSQANSQILTFPLAFDLSTVKMELWERNASLFIELGFDMESLGPNSITIRSAPPELQGKEIEFINECLEMLQTEQPINPRREAYAMMACKAALKAGESLNRTEMAVMINDLLQVEDYKNCPHGRPTIVEIKQGDLEKLFKRK